MRSFIFISRIYGDDGGEYNNLKSTFKKVFHKYFIDVPRCPENIFGSFNGVNILLINGNKFNVRMIDRKYLENIQEESYEKIIEEIKNKYYLIIKHYENNELDSFKDQFPHKTTIICIHWGGEEKRETNHEKIIEIIEDKMKKGEEVYKFTYFSTQDNEFYKYITTFEKKENIIKALDFYEIRANSQFLKKHIYELVENIFICGLPYSDKENIEPFNNGEIIEKYEWLVKIKEKRELNYVDKLEKLLNLLDENDDGITIRSGNLFQFRNKAYEILEKIPGPIYPVLG